jgi:hypothetical protein
MGKIGCLLLLNAPIGASNQQKKPYQTASVFLVVNQRMDLTWFRKQFRSLFVGLGQQKLRP